MAGEMWTLAQTRIGETIKRGSISDLKSALADGEDVFFQDRKGNTYVHFVCTMYRPYIFNILVAKGININARNKHGNTALHVSALHRECGHVSDLMMYGVDPFLTNKDGKIASDLIPNGVYWQTIYKKYQPGIFRAVELHDIERVQHLLHCWCKTDSVRDGQTLRQYAAARKHHDIVLMLDRQRHTSDAIFGVLEVDHYKTEHAVNSEKCNINFLNKASELKHILLHALRLHDLKMVQLVCKAGANINLPIKLENYLKAPLYFAAISPKLPLDVVWTVLKTKPDFLLKDQRGRNAVVFALDKSNRGIPIEIIQYMMHNGVYLGDRDVTGVTARDVSRLARRHDVLKFLNRMFIKLLREEEMEKLERLAQDGYDSMLINFNYRDTYIYACGNETDTVIQFVQQLPEFQSRVRQAQEAVKTRSVDDLHQLLDGYPHPSMLANCKDKGGRTLLHLSVLHWRTDVTNYLLTLPYVDCNAQDNLLRTAYHYACAMEEEEKEDFKSQLRQAGCDTQVLDCCWLTGDDYENQSKSPLDLDTERKVIYGMDRQLFCIDKYEELRAIIRNKRRSLKDFKAAIKHFKYPVVSFATILGPALDDYRDLVFLAVDSGQEDIAEYLAHLGADMTRREKYTVKDDVIQDDHSSKVSATSSELVEQAAMLPFVETAEPDSDFISIPTTVSDQQSEGSGSVSHCSSQAEMTRRQEPEDELGAEASDPPEEQSRQDATREVFLTVVERARLLGLEDLVQVFEKKLEFRKQQKRQAEQGTDASSSEYSSDNEEYSSSEYSSYASSFL